MDLILDHALREEPKQELTLSSALLVSQEHALWFVVPLFINLHCVNFSPGNSPPITPLTFTRCIIR